LSTSTLKLRELLHSDDSGEWGESPCGTNDLLILRAGNIADETWLDLSDVVHRTITEPKRTKLLLREGDILLERSGGTDTRPVGRVAFVDRDMEAGFSNFLHRLRVNRSIAYPSYVRFVLAHWHRSGRAVALQTQTTGIRNLMFSRYLDEPIRLPSLIAQRKFASILESATASLAHTDALIAAKREQKRGLMQQLLNGKVRFPGFTEPWKPVAIGDLLEENARKVEWDDERVYRLISIRRRNGGVFPREALPGSKILTKSLFAVEPGDLLISCRQVVHGAIAVVPAEHGGSCISGEYLCLRERPGAQIDSRFFNLIAHLPAMRKLTLNCSYGVHIEKLNLDVAKFMRSQICVAPTLEEQNRIVQFFCALEQQLALLQEQRVAMAAQRRGLMERLLSGEIDIPSSDTSAA
jgi:type I restriction enzyme S subunit